MKNYRFCPICGSKLNKLEKSNSIWTEFYQCSSTHCGEYFIQVVDLRYTFPLIETYPTTLELFNSLSPEEAKIAEKKINRIDSKTVSIVEFENYVLVK